MRFQKFVSRSTKGIFIFLVAILSGTMGGSSDKEGGGEAGVIFDNVHVTLRDWTAHHEKAVPAYWWNNGIKDFVNPKAGFRRRRPPQPQPPKEDQLVAQAWENLILLEDARRKGITASEEEVNDLLSRIFHTVNRGGQLPQNDEGFQQIASYVFRTQKLSVFMAWLEDQVVIDKLMGLVEEGEFCDYSRVHAETQKSHRMARVWVAGLDPKEYIRDLKPARPEEVSKYYEANKDRYKVGEKVQIAYLMAEYDEFKKKIAEPAEDEVRKYYEDHKDEFRKPKEEHAHAPGEEHKEGEAPQHKDFEEVRSQIPDKVKLEKARVEAKKLMERVDKEDIGASYKDGKWPEDLFDRIKDKYKREGIVLVHDVTGAFDARHVDDVEKIVGENGDLGKWPFELDRKAGDISRRNDTVKGSLVYRIQKKNASYHPGLTDPVRKTIEKDLEKEQLMKRAGLVANGIVQEIKARGFPAARRKYPAVEWRPSRYFGPRNAHESGIEEPRLAQIVIGQVRDGQLALDKKATTVPGSTVSWAPEKKDWSYAVYLEDVVEKAPEDTEAEFKQERDQMDGEARDEYRKDYIKKTKALANIKDSRPGKEEEKKAQDPKG